MRRTGRRDEREETLDGASRFVAGRFFPLGDSYDREAELTDLETTSRRLARPVLAARRTVASSKRTPRAPLRRKATTRSQSRFKISHNPAFVPIPCRPLLEASRDLYSSFPIVRREPKVPFARRRTPIWVRIRARRSSLTSSSMTSPPRIRKNFTRERGTC